ncbi:MAG: BrnA antitoxin family protein [Rhodocyclaceae bacterium]|nr:BrnA antitoxin family protein [Rhodocyclaceae bacterium]
MSENAGTSQKPWIDPDDAAELDEAWFERADLYDGATLARRGRRPAAVTKVALTVRYDADVVAAFRASGKGWQTRMNDALREWLAEHPQIGSQGQ